MLLSNPVAAAVVSKIDRFTAQLNRLQQANAILQSVNLPELCQAKSTLDDILIPLREACDEIRDELPKLSPVIRKYVQPRYDVINRAWKAPIETNMKIG